MNLAEPGLAFAEGLALIASPCILPVLPLVLSASIEGGRKRPFGIILGFVLAFSAFALASRKLVAAFHIDLDIIKNVSLLLLFLLGVVLVSERLSARFSQLTQGAANLGGTLSSSGGSGFFSGILIGALIGLVWTPCAGPILAAVLVQVIKQQTDGEGLLIILAFAFGAGMPMLIIALMGRKIIGRLGFFTKHAEAVRKTFGAIIIFAVFFIASGADVQSFFSHDSKHLVKEGPLALETALPKPYSAPEFAGIDGWINSPPLTMKQLKGKVVLVDFWTYSCINCVRTLPYLTEWDKKYRDKGLVIVGVHAPEFEFEKKIENVRRAVLDHNIHYPVALDSELATWSHFNNRFWPAHYLINRDGQVVYTHFGEGEYEVTENNIRFLLGLKDRAAADDKGDATGFSSSAQTPETYLGYKRMDRYGDAESIVRDADNTYIAAPNLPLHDWSLSGKWKIEGEKIVSAEAGAALQLHFKGRKIFLVLGTQAGAPVTATLTLNGEPVDNYAGKDAPNGRITVNGHTLYELIDQKDIKEGVLEIKAGRAGLEAYAFTFGS